MHDTNNGSVLLVEDDTELREELAAALNDAGYDVMAAANGLEARTRLQGGARPDVILLDLLMPVMDGWSFCEATRHDPAVAQIPIVVMSGAASRDPQSPYFIDVDDFVAKPINLDDLLIKLRKYVVRPQLLEAK